MEVLVAAYGIFTVVSPSRGADVRHDERVPWRTRIKGVVFTPFHFPILGRRFVKTINSPRLLNLTMMLRWICWRGVSVEPDGIRDGHDTATVIASNKHDIVDAELVHKDTQDGATVIASNKHDIVDADIPQDNELDTHENSLFSEERDMHDFTSQHIKQLLRSGDGSAIREALRREIRHLATIAIEDACLEFLEILRRPDGLRHVQRTYIEYARKSGLGFGRTPLRGSRPFTNSEIEELLERLPASDARYFVELYRTLADLRWLVAHQNEWAEREAKDSDSCYELMLQGTSRSVRQRLRATPRRSLLTWVRMTFCRISNKHDLVDAELVHKDTQEGATAIASNNHGIVDAEDATAIASNKHEIVDAEIGHRIPQVGATVIVSNKHDIVDAELVHKDTQERATAIASNNHGIVDAEDATAIASNKHEIVDAEPVHKDTQDGATPIASNKHVIVDAELAHKDTQDEATPIASNKHDIVDAELVHKDTQDGATAIASNNHGIVDAEDATAIASNKHEIVDAEPVHKDTQDGATPIASNKHVIVDAELAHKDTQDEATPIASNKHDIVDAELVHKDTQDGATAIASNKHDIVDADIPQDNELDTHENSLFSEERDMHDFTSQHIKQLLRSGDGSAIREALRREIRHLATIAIEDACLEFLEILRRPDGLRHVRRTYVEYARKSGLGFGRTPLRGSRPFTNSEIEELLERLPASDARYFVELYRTLADLRWLVAHQNEWAEREAKDSDSCYELMLQGTSRSVRQRLRATPRRSLLTWVRMTFCRISFLA